MEFNEPWAGGEWDDDGVGDPGRIGPVIQSTGLSLDCWRLAPMCFVNAICWANIFFQTSSSPSLSV